MLSWSKRHSAVPCSSQTNSKSGSSRGPKVAPGGYTATPEPLIAKVMVGQVLAPAGHSQPRRRQRTLAP
jgi:hypothetical protein